MGLCPEGCNVTRAHVHIGHAVFGPQEKEEFNYRELLKKYIQHVGDSEGTDFLGDFARNDFGCDPDRFTDEEWAELQRLR